MDNRRHTDRKPFSYYMKVVEDRTMKVLGHMNDISPKGFKIDSDQNIPVGKEFHVRLDLTPDISARPFIAFMVVCRWCKQDEFDLRTYNVGFEVMRISPQDDQIFQNIVKKYAAR